MASFLLSVALLVLSIQTVPSAIATKADPLVRVSDDNWQIVLEGEWMLEFMAPWCPACRSFQSTWQGFAEWGRDLDISIGVVDITESPALNGRFLVTSLPTILHVKDGVFRPYKGSRKENDLVSFVDDKEWQDVDPVSAWIHPNSLQMGVLGSFFKFAMTIRNLYNHMTREYGIPEWACFVIFAVVILLTGLLVGLMIVLCCDCLFPPKQKMAKAVITKEVGKNDEDDDSDVIEDATSEQGKDGETGDSNVRRRHNVVKDDSAAAADS